MPTQRLRHCGAQARAAELAELLKAEQSKSAQRQDRIQEQEGALSVLKAEFAQRHTERETLREKVEQLEKENKLLIQRFIDYKNMEAERMNEITDMYEHARRKSTIDESKKVQSGLASPRLASPIPPTAPLTWLPFLCRRSQRVIRASSQQARNPTRPLSTAPHRTARYQSTQSTLMSTLVEPQTFCNPACPDRELCCRVPRGRARGGVRVGGRVVCLYVQSGITLDGVIGRTPLHYNVTLASSPHSANRPSACRTQDGGLRPAALWIGARAS